MRALSLAHMGRRALQQRDEILYYEYRWFVLADPEDNKFCVIGHTDK